MTTIRTKDGWSYTISEGDRMWLARSVDGEGGTAGDVIWAYLQRLALRGFRNQTLSQVVQGHSQPINPAWLEDGRFCRPGGQYAGTDACSPARLARRAIIRAKSWDDLQPDTKAAILALDAGTLPNRVPRAVDFATEPIVQSYVSRHPDARVLSSPGCGNCFIAYPESLRWPDEFVTIGPSSSVKKWLWLGAGLSAAAAGYFIWRSVR